MSATDRVSAAHAFGVLGRCLTCRVLPAVQTAMSFPDWVAALDKLQPKLASAIRFALAAAASEGDRYQPAPNQKSKSGAKATAPAKKADPKVTLAFVSYHAVSSELQQ